MNRTPPREFSQLGLAADTFRYSDARSWRGACPTCGGHHRFVVFTDHDFPFWHGYCSLCGLKEKYWERFKREPESPERRAQREADYAKEQAEVQARRAARLAEFTTAELWQELHNRMQTAERAWWRTQGIPDSLQDFWKLGYEKSHTCKTDNGNWITPAYTIPYFHFDVTGDPRFVTMQFRLATPPNPKDRYRFAYGLGATYYDTYPYETLREIVIICEGAKKAQNVFQMIDPNKISVIAQPNNLGDYGTLDYVKNCGRVFILFDPDSIENAIAKARQIGTKARVVELPEKADDMRQAGRLDETRFRVALRHARKVQ